MTEHAVSMVVLSDGRYRSRCSCGYAGIRTHDRTVAEAQAEQHLAYCQEVNALTSRPAHQRQAAETGEG